MTPSFARFGHLHISPAAQQALHPTAARWNGRLRVSAGRYADGAIAS
jgi:hypothetical protein